VKLLTWFLLLKQSRFHPDAYAIQKRNNFTPYMKKIHPFLFAILAFCFSCGVNPGSSTQTGNSTQTGAAAAGAATYTNPVLPGDYADPSVVRVGDDYWATATSSEWAPLFPLLHSKNLVDWETVGHVFPDKGPAWADAHYWAPEISYEKGKFYIYYTARKKGGNLCVGVASATKATGPYTDHGPLVCQEVGSIDGFPVRDEKGDLYLVWKEDGNSKRLPTPIWGQRMNEARTALEGEKFELFRNDSNTWEGGLVEGPAFVKRGDYFYIFYAGDACCGRSCTYGVGVARSKSLRGPWEKFAGNPIMQKNDDWRCPGHGTVVADPQGRDFFLYHAYNAKTTVYPGRQGLLDQIHWGADNWPSFENRSPSLTDKVPVGQNKPDVLDMQDEFTTSTLASSWQWSVEQTPKITLQPGKGGSLLLQASPNQIGTLVGQRTKTAAYTASAALVQQALPAGTIAGLAAIGDPANAIGIAVGNGEVMLWQMKGNKMNMVSHTAAPKTDKIYFRLTTADAERLQFAWSPDGTAWKNLGEPVFAAYLPPWDRGVRVGLTAKGPANATAAFDWFKLMY
jgi:beta-xylosidase